MIRRTLSICVLAAAAAFAQQPGPDKAALQQRLGEVKQSIAQNQAQLKQYAWTETVAISLKGEEKKRNQNDCKYGPDGKVQKTPIGAAPPPAKGRKGLKGKIVANKIDDMKKYMDRVGSLVRRYLPPDPKAMQSAFQSGKATPDAASGTLAFHDYAKPGDKFTFTFDTETKKLRSIDVATYLDSPKDTVTVNARFSSLADGTNFLEESVLDASAKEIQIKTTNSEHHKAGS
jgi:hypothetical protein